MEKKQFERDLEKAGADTQEKMEKWLGYKLSPRQQKYVRVDRKRVKRRGHYYVVLFDREHKVVKGSWTRWKPKRKKR